MLADFRARPFNYRLDAPHEDEDGWHLDLRCEQLPSEPPGEPIEGGSWEIARRMAREYAFADPELVRGYFDPMEPLDGRTMVLELRVFVARIYAGVRVTRVFDEHVELEGRPVRRWGWSYGTLEGHVERGERTFETRKWLDTGEVEFTTRAFSQPASRNPFMRLGFRIIGRPRQQRFVEGVVRRGRALVEEALSRAARTSREPS